MNRILYPLFLLILFPSVLLGADVDCKIAETAIDQASSLRGLPVLRKVPCKLQGKKEVEQYLRDVIDKEIPKDRIENEEKVYKLIGVIPEDFDYVNGLIKLYTDQLGGYYDPKRDYYAMANWMPAAMQLPIAVHELTHALQDQHYNLETLIDHKKGLSDALMAKSALVEGDATAVMIDYSRSLVGKSSIAKESSVGAFMLQNISGAMISNSMQKTPPALRDILIFPYVSGLYFAHAVLKTGGYELIDKAYVNLPQSTEEILHPEIYLSGKKSFKEISDPIPPEKIKLTQAKPLYSDRLGEFFISTLLGSWLSKLEASQAASGWGGDRISLYSSVNSSRGVLLWSIHWDTEEDAKEFFEAIISAYSIRFSEKPVKSASSASFFNKFTGSVRVRLREKEVLLTMGY